MIDFKPKIISALKNYDRKTFSADLMAGIIVGIVALPLAIAFGIASGVTPEKGIITAIIGGFIISLLGGSNVQIGGPTGAFIIIVYGIIQQYGEIGLLVSTLLAGILLLLMGLFKLGTIIKFIPYPIIVGFTSGIAVTIFTTQISDVFGLSFGDEKLPGDFIGKWIMYFKHIHTINWWETAVCFASIGLIVITPRFSKKIPGSLVAIIVLTIIAYALKTVFGITSIDTIGDRFIISSEIPGAEIPKLDFESIKSLIPVSITIAVLGAVESLLSATVADGVTGQRHNSNTELIAQGVANMVVPLFSGIPATGAIARTMTNINNGGKTPVAGIIHAIVLLLIMLFLMPLAKYIPMACLAGVLVIVAYNMSEWRTFKAFMNNPKSDVAVLLVTFFLTVIFDLVIAIQVGLVLAFLLFMKRITETSEVSVIRDKLNIHGGIDATDEEKLMIPKGVEVYEIEGPYFFGVANKFEEQTIILGNPPKVRIIRMRMVPFIDSTGIHNFTNFCKNSQKDNINIILSDVNPDVNRTLERSGFFDIVSRDNICSNIVNAIKRAEELLAELEQNK
ncbi:MAG: sulfate permease [Bacteroidales bacterium]|nr:sulfate permease [Bacteroidales bacterium]